MNLLDAPWIPARRANGATQWISPYQITDQIDTNPIISLDTPRADFNGALIQFFIGLIQTAWMCAGEEWDCGTMLWDPPSPDALREYFAPLREAFELDGDGARFMQDRTLSVADKPAENNVTALLIEAPGEQTLKRNTDHFVKRRGPQAFCENCAATALFTLMTNAPSGGAGHRTGLRGGGPLTTLVIYDPETAEHPPRALWRTIASNVLDTTLLRGPGANDKNEPRHIFPWLAPQDALQSAGSKAETQPLDVHPAHMFWAMPRRIRLDFAHATRGQCDLCGRGDQRLISKYVSKNYGLNYKGPWQHPLSPYYRSKPNEPALAVHPQASGLGYRHWLGWVLGTSEAKTSIEPALTVHAFQESQGGGPFRLWAFGFDMDNMKPRGWHEATFPLFDLPHESPDAQESLRGIVNALLVGADKAVQALRMHVRDVWFGNGEARGDLSFIDASFWGATEADFFDRVREAAQLIRVHGRPPMDLSVPLRETWLGQIRRAARRLFDQYASSGDVEACHPERLAKAHAALERQLGTALRKAVGLNTPRQFTQAAERQPPHPITHQEVP